MRNLIAAIRFLTIIPLPGKLGTSEADISGSMFYFPIIGLLIGLAAAGLSTGLWIIFPQLPASTLLVVFLLAVSGALHMDGLCDTADGFFSSRPREQIFEIMRDSRVGAMGVMVIVVCLAVKIAALSIHDREGIWPVALLMPLAGRTALVVLMAVLPYARAEGGLASLFYGRPVRFAALWSVGLLMLAAWLCAGPAGCIAAGVSLVFVMIFAWYCRYKIGGATGDTLGAGCELAEAVMALVFSSAPVLEMLG